MSNNATQNNKISTVYILWGTARTRAIEIAKRFNALLYAVNYKLPIVLPFRYIICLIQSISFLCKKRPNLVITQIGPIFNALAVYIYTTIFSGKYILDVHSGEILSEKWRLFSPLRKFLFGKAFYVFVHNTDNYETVKSWGWKTKMLILNDPIPEPKEGDKIIFCKNCREVVFITSFQYGEPYVECLKAANILNKDKYNWKCVFTGNYKLVDLPFKPPNVIFTGYINYKEYWSILKGADVIVSINNRDSVITCGVWEALSLNKPTVTNNFDCIIDRFGEIFIYTDNSSPNIAMSIKKAYSKKSEITNKSKQFKNDYISKWNKKFLKIKNNIKSSE